MPLERGKGASSMRASPIKTGNARMAGEESSDVTATPLLVSSRGEGAVVDMVNSTAVGGGVAEILNGLLPLARELGLEARWHVMEGAPEFYDVTKGFHN